VYHADFFSEKIILIIHVYFYSEKQTWPSLLILSQKLTWPAMLLFSKINMAIMLIFSHKLKWPSS